MRLIDADALEARMYHDAFETDSDMQKWDSGCWIRYKMFERALEDAPTIELSHWIPCSERPPEEGERVLATHLGGLNPNRQVIEHIYQSGQFTLGWDMDMDIKSPTFGKRQMGKVIAWMSMPEPYNGGEEHE